MRLLTRLCTTVAALTVTAAVSPAADAPLVLRQTIPLKGVAGKLDHLSADAAGRRLFVANKPNNTLDIVDLKTGKLVKQIADQGKVSGVEYAADLDMIYVGNGAGVCNGFDGKTYARVFSTPAKGADNVHYSAATKSVYVAHDGHLSELDAKSGELRAAIPLPGAPHGFALDAKAGKAFVVLTKPSAVAVVDLAKREVTGQFPLTLADAGSPIARDAEKGLLFVGCPKKGMVVTFDEKTGKEVGGVKIPDGVDDLHFDAKRKRLYASCGDGPLVVLGANQDKYEEVARIETPKFSRTCAFSEATGQLYLGVPLQEGKDGPEVRVYEAPTGTDGK